MVDNPMNPQQKTDAGQNRDEWRLATWPDGHTCEKHYVDGQYIGEWRANEKGRIFKDSDTVTGSKPADPASEAGAGAHTPGPWKASESGVCVTSGPFDDQPNCLQQTAVYPRICTLNCSDFSLDMRIANAKLIAAAPETAVERDRLRRLLADETKALDEAIDDYGKVVIQRDQAREQVKTLLAILDKCETSLVAASHHCVQPMMADDARKLVAEVRAAIAAVENAKEGQ